ncbi:PepSY domain-containing protein [Propionimicrobium sp. PCR01-08-3]|uniref:PepSY domain-containing protein n=1 Tax=Propionimicrobium sp. PCR01-08-3 TaxID=3052086 RepID=UPI00255C7EA3|nr:PepSY domain-containing protein [Propionimicrobium sp. PCR01-08-3]WIY82724.1 PepSY domain-containing protein [Propionimicrobium sp. PCR01-08-3]
MDMADARGWRQARTAAIVAAVLALGLAGCSSDGSDRTSPSTEMSASDASGANTPSDQTSMPAPEMDASITQADADLREVTFAVAPEDAVQIATEQAGADQIVHQIEIDYSESRGIWEWDIQILVDGVDHEVEINADSAEVVNHEQEQTSDQEQQVDLNTPMTLQQAQDLATAEVDGPISGWKLEWDDGMTTYEFDIGADNGREVEVSVNVETGAVVVEG